MVVAIALDRDGNPIGEKREFTKKQWDALLKFGKHLRWKKIKTKKEIKEEKNEESRDFSREPVGSDQ